MLIDSIITLVRGGNVDLQFVIAQILSVLFIIALILPLHEFAHGFIAVKLGDPTPKYDKRLTLNPLASIDPVGSLALLLFGFGWAKPVQVNARNFKSPKRDMAFVAIAGPISNLLAALVGEFIRISLIVLNVIDTSHFVSDFISSYVLINISLAVFNLIPIPPLDGSRVVSAFLSDRAMYTYYKYQNIIFMIFFVTMFSGLLSTPLIMARNFFYNIIFNIAAFPWQAMGF